jgi:glycosyltransferase involved in cell wall biosynthesis
MRILFSGDSPTVTTGFGIVAKNIVNRLAARGHQISVLGINHYGDPYDPKEFPYPIYPCDKGSNPDQIFGYRKLWHIANEFQPDVLFFLNDPWIIDKYLDAKSVDSPYLKTIAYFPIDSGPLKPEWAKTLTELDAQICYSEFGARIITEANDGKRPKNLHQIYHGVNRKVFFPINQQLARQRLGIPLNSFVVGMVARNQYRKRFDILVSAFAEFAKDKPEAKLYLHTALEDIGFDIRDLVRQFDLGDKLILTDDISPAHGVPEEFLNYIYNSMDVNVLLSLGDGFGLPVAESMAVGCPQLVSDHSCLKELVEGHGGLTVNTAAWILNTSGINTWGGVPDVDDTVEKLNLLYNSRELRIKLAEDGYEYISQDKFDWDNIADQFERIIKDTLHVLPISKVA